MIGFFYGCTTMNNPELKLSVDKLIEKLQTKGIPIKKIGQKRCCGIPLILTGHIEKAKNFAIEGLKEMDGIDTIVTTCPHCYTAFAHEYKEKLNIDVNFNVLHVTIFINSLIKDNKIKLKENKLLNAGYHDPCFLGREGDGIYDEPREILTLSGVELKDYSYTREDTVCCGGGGLLRAALPKISVEVAKSKIEKEVLPANIKYLFSSCPFCFINLKEGAEFAKEDIQVYDLVSYIVDNIE